MNEETHANIKGVNVQECDDCGLPKHGLFCDTRTELSNGGKDVCLWRGGLPQKIWRLRNE